MGQVCVVSRYEYSAIWVDPNHLFSSKRVKNPQPEHNLFNKQVDPTRHV